MVPIEEQRGGSSSFTKQLIEVALEDLEAGKSVDMLCIHSEQLRIDGQSAVSEIEYYH